MKKRQFGFTLIEIIIAIAILGILGFIFTDILTQVLRGQNKSKIVSLVKQAGQTIMNDLSTQIRESEKVVCVGTNTDNAGKPEDTVVIYKNGEYVRFRFIPPSDEIGGNKNGYIKRNDFTADNIIDVTSNAALCTDNTDQDQARVSNLTNINATTGVSLKYNVENGNSRPIFTKDSRAGFADSVTISFRVSQGTAAGNAYESAVASDGILFTTTVQVKGGK